MLSRLGVVGPVVCLCVFSLVPAVAAEKPQDVSFEAGKYRLHGCVWTPEGSGPYPVIIYNHGSEQDPKPCGPPDLGAFYQKHGWAFFAFQRHGHGPSPGEYIGDLQKKAFATAPGRAEAQEEINRLHERYNLDVEAAVGWVKQQKWTDTGRIVMTGISYGGIQTLLTAEKGLGLRAFLPFAPAAQSWNPVLAERLKEAIRKARGPIFLIQAQNDYSLEPSKVLGAELARKGPPNHAKIYPPFGTTTQMGHGWFGSRAAGIEVWSADVIAFLDATVGMRREDR
jgi:dienelactone hydrolase